MGTWSCGNYDNDGALDYVGSIIDKLVARIEETLADETLAEVDEDGERILMPSVDMISILCERSRCATPKPETIESWQKRYLEVFDAGIEGLQPTEGYVAARRAVIAQTFEKLLEQARKFWRED